jgi:hypothetical protein
MVIVKNIALLLFDCSCSGPQLPSCTLTLRRWELWNCDCPAPEATVAELAHVSDQPYAELGLCRFLRGPTITSRLLFVFVILSRDRRRPIHLAVTANPTAEWTTRQLLEAFPWDSAPRYLLRDRDACYGVEVKGLFDSMRWRARGDSNSRPSGS